MLFCIGTGEPGAPAPAEGGGSVLRLLSNQNFNPTRLIVVSFGAIILLGTFLLHLPISARDGQFTPWLTCLFTATSATCVTGLVLVDSALHWTPFGQGVILAMIQLGGLGFVSLISLIPLLLRRRIGLPQRLAIASAFNLNGMSGVVRVVRHALMGTFLLEGCGAILLATRFVPLFGWGRGLWYSIFHSVSAFCNAGFDLMGEHTGAFSSLAGFREAGVNRISFGVQSARDTQLRTLGRPHNAKQARAAFAAARRAGFENISGDIMLALPHYTQAEFDETLELIAEGGATHISAYLLKIEPDSAFGRHPPEGLPSPDEAADFYLYAVEHLEHHGYRQYEISNFAKPGYEGRHNLIYWDCGDYLGLGPAAHSCMGGRRFYYPADTEAFLNDKAAPVMDGGCGAEDYLILQLRLRKGLDLAAYKARYGKEFSTAQLAFVKNCVKSGYATFDGSTLALTPAGLIVQNSILAELL